MVQGTINETYLIKTYDYDSSDRKVVCINSMHKTNLYGFKLATIIVPDEW